MFTSSTSFKKRLFITGMGLLVIIILAAAILFAAARQHSFYLERTAHAQHVYSSYLVVSDHIYRKLNAMGSIVADGDIVDIDERYRNQKALRNALKEVHDNINDDFQHVKEDDKKAELIHFNNLSEVAEKIIRGSDLIRTAVESDDRSIAVAELNRLRSSQIEGYFNDLIDVALEEEERQLRESEQIALNLSQLLSKSLPILAFFFLLLGATLIYASWKALTRSLRVFEQAADAYKVGNFDYQIQGIEETEFSDLADALNNMASEVRTQREREKVSQENLESLISLRTGELERSNEKLETISETRKQFLADISHELRTPLTIIRGETDMALRGKPKESDQYIDTLGRVREQVIHTTRLVQDLLFVARTEGGKAPIHRSVEVIVPLVKEICNDFRILAQERDIKIIDSYANSDLVANIDAGRIKQVVTILLDNAIRYSHKSSEIQVHVKQFEEQAALTISDTGIGLSNEEESQVFSRFYRGNAGMEAASGTGLGLPVAKAIIDAHGGSITLQGETDKGSTATVILPIEKKLRPNH